MNETFAVDGVLVIIWRGGEGKNGLIDGMSLSGIVRRTWSAKSLKARGVVSNNKP